MGQSTEELTSEIAGTRQRMASDLDALQDRVSPSAIVERRKTAAKDRVSSIKGKVMGHAQGVRSSTSSTTSNVAGNVQGSVSGAAGSVQGAASSAASATQDRIEGSPLAAGLVAFGAGMVIAGMFPATRREAAAASTIIDTAQEKGAPLMEHAKSVGQEMGQDLKQTATEAAQQVKETATDSAARVKDEGQSAAETVKSEAQTQTQSSGDDQQQGGSTGYSTGGTYTTGPQY